MRNKFGNWFNEYVTKNEKVYLLSGDIGYGVFDNLRIQNTERFINCGVAEQNMIGVAAGMASKGLEPWVYTIIPFLLYRPFEFVRNLICHQNLNVKLIGVGGGVVYDTLGFTHFALEDVGLTKSLPHLETLLPYDPLSALELFEVASHAQHPTYVRLMKGGEAEIPKLTFEDGLDIIHEGGEITLFGHGGTVSELYEAAKKLKGIGKDCKVVALTRSSHLKFITKHLSSKNYFFEEHFPGGLFSEFNKLQNCKVYNIEYETLQHYQTRQEILRENNMSSDMIVKTILDDF